MFHNASFIGQIDPNEVNGSNVRTGGPFWLGTSLIPNGYVPIKRDALRIIFRY